MASTNTPGDRVKKLRMQAGLSRDELAIMAKRGDPSRRNGATIGIWERGKGTTLETARQVSEVLADKLNRQRGDILSYIVWG